MAANASISRGCQLLTWTLHELWGPPAGPLERSIRRSFRARSAREGPCAARGAILARQACPNRLARRDGLLRPGTAPEGPLWSASSRASQQLDLRPFFAASTRRPAGTARGFEREGCCALLLRRFVPRPSRAFDKMSEIARSVWNPRRPHSFSPVFSPTCSSATARPFSARLLPDMVSKANNRTRPLGEQGRFRGCFGPLDGWSGPTSDCRQRRAVVEQVAGTQAAERDNRWNCSSANTSGW